MLEMEALQGEMAYFIVYFFKNGRNGLLGTNEAEPRHAVCTLQVGPPGHLPVFHPFCSCITYL